MVMWIPFIAVGAAGVLSVDGWVRRRAAADVGASAGSAADGEAGAPPGFERRVLVRGGLAAAAAAVATGVLAGAGAGLGRLFDRGKSKLGPVAASPTPTPSATRASPSASSSGSPSSGATKVAATADLPVGGAVRFIDPATGKPAYVVQPTTGTYRGFSAICTHAGCTVNWAAKDSRFVCPCHASIYDGTTGKVISGPAPSALPPVKVQVADGAIEVPKA